MRKVALFILSRYLWPVDGGRKESLNHYIKELYDNYGYTIYVLCFADSKEYLNEQCVPDYISEVKVLSDVSFFERIKNIIFHSFFNEKWPLQCSLFYSKKNASIIKEYTANVAPNIIFTEMIRTCSYFSCFENSNSLKIANLDDLLSLRYERQLKSRKSKSFFLGAYGTKIPSFLAPLLSLDFIKKTILNLESNLCRNWEDLFYQKFDYVLMTSNNERDILNNRMHSNKAKTLSVGVDCKYYGQDIDIEIDERGLSFVGNFFVAANADSLKMIVEEVLPLIKINYRFYVIGKCPDYLVKQYECEKIVFCGRVNDLREYVKKTTVFFSPLAYGTGVKTKIVEAMAMGIPVVTNSVGAEGIDAVSGTDIIVSDNFCELAFYTEKLLEDPTYRKKIGDNGRFFAERNFSWEKVFRVYKEIGV